MDASHLRDLIAKGMGKAAQKVGVPFVVYRPHGAFDPLSERNRVIKLFAAFEPENKSARRAVGPMWRGIFDALYTRSGDYLVGACQTFFVASQTMNLPAQCVLTNRLVSLTRPSFTNQGGYSGHFASSGDAVITNWPASLVAGGGRAETIQSGGTTLGNWTLLLPTLPSPPQSSDVVTDDTGSSYVVAQAEQNLFGWRVLLKEVSL